MEFCHQCGEPVGRLSAWMVIGGVKRYFHTALFLDCMNEWNKKQAKEIAAAKQKTISAVVAQHAS